MTRGIIGANDYGPSEGSPLFVVTPGSVRQIEFRDERPASTMLKIPRRELRGQEIAKLQRYAIVNCWKHGKATMTNATDVEVNAMRAQALTNPSHVACPRCGGRMNVTRSIADRYVPNDLLEQVFEGLPGGREWRLLTLDLRCENCFPSAVAVAL